MVRIVEYESLWDNLGMSDIIYACIYVFIAVWYFKNRFNFDSLCYCCPDKWWFDSWNEVNKHPPVDRGCIVCTYMYLGAVEWISVWYSTVPCLFPNPYMKGGDVTMAKLLIMNCYDWFNCHSYRDILGAQICIEWQLLAPLSLIAIVTVRASWLYYVQHTVNCSNTMNDHLQCGGIWHIELHLITLFVDEWIPSVHLHEDKQDYNMLLIVWNLGV